MKAELSLAYPVKSGVPAPGPYSVETTRPIRTLACKNSRKREFPQVTASKPKPKEKVEMIFIRWWNQLRNRPLITQLQREVTVLNQIIDSMEEVLKEHQRPTQITAHAHLHQVKPE